MRISDWSSDVCSSDLPASKSEDLHRFSNSRVCRPFFHPVALHKARPAMDICEVDHPQRVRPADAELPVHLVERTWSFGIADGRHASLSAPYPCQAHGAHQPLDRAFGYCRSLSAHLVPDLADRKSTRLNSSHYC